MYQHQQFESSAQLVLNLFTPAKQVMSNTASSIQIIVDVWYLYHRIPAVLLLDTHRAQWCSGTVCGNRA